jgi:hypothetical protein
MKTEQRNTLKRRLVQGQFETDSDWPENVEDKFESEKRTLECGKCAASVKTSHKTVQNLIDNYLKWIAKKKLRHSKNSRTIF